jgi:uncharacterized protein YodC (DUF2158 family)
MLYNALTPRGINMRTAPTPWGPWSATDVLFDPGSDGGYGHFMHASWRDNGRADSVHDPNRENEWGGEYGPYLIPRYTRRVHDEVHVYFVMSTWNPYNTVLMRARLRLDPWRGWYSLVGATFPPGAGVTSVSRGPDRMEVCAVDATGTVRGRWFDGTWHDWYSLAGATFPPGASVMSKPGDRKVGGLRHLLARFYRSVPSFRSSTTAVLRQRIVSGENGSVNGIPFALRSGLSSRRTR